MSISYETNKDGREKHIAAKQKIPNIAIIPAKRDSMRCPGKNIRGFQGKPLFVHSVNYAFQEGLVPVVSTDCEIIKKQCQELDVLCLEESVDDRKMDNCIRQVLEQVECEYFALLQPTSPLRKPNLLKGMLDDLKKEHRESAVTVQQIKMVGFLDGVFNVSYREQDAKRFFYFTDGNIYLSSYEGLKNNGTHIHQNSKIYINEFPCCLQIDTEMEFSALSHLAALPEMSAFLPCRPFTSQIAS